MLSIHADTIHSVDREDKQKKIFQYSLLITRLSNNTTTTAKRDALSEFLLLFFSGFVICLMMIQIIELFLYLQFRVASRRSCLNWVGVIY